MSRMRIKAKIRKNPDYTAAKEFLRSIGLRHTVHPHPGKGHPFMKIHLPDGSTMTFSVACTPGRRINRAAVVARLKREMIKAGALPPAG